MLSRPRQSTSPLILGLLAVLLVLTVGLGMVVARMSPTVSLAIVVGIVIFIFSFSNIQFALYLLIFATLLSPEFGSRTTTGSGVTLRLDDLLLLVIGFSQLTRSAVHQEVGLFSWTPLNRYIAYYMLACVFSTGVGMIAGRVRFLSGFFFVLKYFEYFIVYFLLVNNLGSKEQAKRYLLAILLTAAIVSLIALAQVPTGQRVVAPFEGEQGEPNTLGGYLLLISAVAGGLLLTRNAVQAFHHRVALLSLLGLMFIVILFTLSRATWLATVPVYVAFVLLSDRRLLLGLLGLAVLIASPLIVPESVKERALYTVASEENQWARKQQESMGGITFDTSSSARIKSWKTALQDFPGHPILGYGVTGWKFIDAQYLRVLLETGLLGLVTFFLLIWAVLRQTWSVYRTINDPLFKGVAMGFLIGTVAMLVHAITANTFIIVRVMEPFWLLAAIVVDAPNLEAEGGEPQASAEEVARTPVPKRT